MGLVLGFLAVVTVGPAIAMVLAGVRLSRRSTVAHRVPVEAVVVHFENFRQPARVTFDYPAPDGTWLRDRKVAGLVAMQRQGFGVQPGDRLTVWVDPRNPRDVSLGDIGSAGGFAGVALVGGGVVWALGGLSLIVTLAGQAR